MATNHLKRITTPATWPILRKEKTFITRPNPGGHAMEYSMPLVAIMKDLLKIASTTREVKFILHKQELLVNGKRACRPDATAGLLDVITLPATKTSYRITLNKRNRLTALPIAGKDATLIPCKVTSKNLLKGGKQQLGFHNGRTLITKEKCSMGDTLLLTFDNKVEKRIPVDKGITVFITAGSHVGNVGTVEKIEENLVTVKVGNDSLQTEKKYAFAVGEKKGEIKVEE